DENASPFRSGTLVEPLGFFGFPLQRSIEQEIDEMPSLRWLSIALLSLLVLQPSLTSAADARAEGVVVPKETIQLFPCKELTKDWYTWLTDDLHEDPRGVFTLQPDGTLRISGDGYGGVITRKEYADYHLVLEYRWGTKTWQNRVKAARDGGLLLHCKGPDGNFGGSGDKPGPWMTSVECQIIEGGVGDILVLQGKDENGKLIEASASATVSYDRDGEPVWDPKGEKKKFTSGRINWFGRDPDWKDVVGFRGAKDPDSPGQEWTTLECFVKGDKLVYRVNGVIVNRAEDVYPTNGKLLLQTEGAEMYVRRLELRPLPKQIP
ncbi:3-keto-disaccharide hydrolase, partial [Schlesneria sp.]|uniref:3-keto-disaccharide hydrolase n=1 Tax=Schlesneria sp. TaxID=2762018 RepID=UPI002EFCE313